MTIDTPGVILKFEYAMMMPKTNRWGNILNMQVITVKRINTYHNNTTILRLVN